MQIFHIVARAGWAAAQRSGEYVPAAFAQDGFVHFSFADQVERVANALYRDVGDLVVVDVESDEVPSELRVEDCYEAGEQFPHIYGPIPTAAARGVLELTRAANGDWVFSPGGAADSASPDR